MQKILHFLTKPWFVGFVFFALVAVATLQALWLSQPNTYTQYNNYIIFKQSFFHLITGNNLYTYYLDECWDLFKYSPAFAAFFGLFAYLPDSVGLFLWNALNAFVLFFAVYKIPHIAVKQKSFMLLFSAIELMTSMQNSQSNGLIAGLLIAAFIMLEKERILWATLFITLTVFIKLFGLVACLLFLFYPKKWLRIVGCMLFWNVLLLLLPALFCGYTQLIFLYKSWLTLLSQDHAVSLGYSVLGFVQTWLHWQVNKTGLLIAGSLCLLIPFIKTKKYTYYFYRIHLLALVLVWMVVFNHKAESPTFIIAVAGIALWFFSKHHIQKADIILMILVFVFTCLAPTDIFPLQLRKHFFEPYVVKAIPCILAWLKISYDAWHFTLRQKKE